MQLSRRRFIAGSTVLLALPASAATGALAPLRARYQMLVGRLPVAARDLQIATVTGSESRLEMVMRSEGLATLFGGRNETRMTTWLAAGPLQSIRPKRFEAVYDKPDRTRSIAIAYAPDGEVETIVVRHNGDERRSPVPEALWAGTVDPLTAFSMVRAWAQVEVADASLTIPVFEGRKRADLVAQAGADGSLSISMQAVFGFDESDTLLSLPGEPAKWFRVARHQGLPSLPARVVATTTSLATEIALRALEFDAG